MHFPILLKFLVLCYQILYIPKSFDFASDDVYAEIMESRRAFGNMCCLNNSFTTVCCVASIDFTSDASKPFSHSSSKKVPDNIRGHSPFQNTAKLTDLFTYQSNILLAKKICQDTRKKNFVLEVYQQFLAVPLIQYLNLVEGFYNF